MSVLLAVMLLQDVPKPEGDDLVLQVGRQGGIVAGGKTLVDPKTPDDLSQLRAVFQERRKEERYAGDADFGRWARYTLFLRIEPLTPWASAFRVVDLAYREGGVQTFVLATSDDFGDHVGFQLPISRGLAGRPHVELPVRLTERGDVWVGGRLEDKLQGDQTADVKTLRKLVERLKALRDKVLKNAGEEFGLAIVLAPDANAGFKQALDLLALAHEADVNLSPAPVPWLLTSAGKR